MLGCFAAACTVDNGHYLLSMLDNDILEQDHTEMIMILKTPPQVRIVKLLYKELSFLQLRKPLSRLMGKRPHEIARHLPLSTSDLRKSYETIGDIRAQFADYWHRLDIDVLLLPAQASPALPVDYPMKVCLIHICMV